ncbi:MAG: ATP-binding cassette domain-containing protein [Aquificaceae bacterium]
MIKLEGIFKSFGKKVLFKDLSLEFERGRTTALLGPNGSGKTTLVKILLGLVIPDRGKVYINKKEIGNDSFHKRLIGYMPQVPEFPENLTLREIVSMVEDLRGEKAKRLEELLEVLNLKPELEKRFMNLSGGTKQKVGALVALAFDQQILILDEPMVGLDPVTAYRLRAFIRKEKENGKTILYISHIMPEVEELADDVVFITEGRVVFKGSVEVLKSSTGKEKLEEAVLCLLS